MLPRRLRKRTYREPIAHRVETVVIVDWGTFLASAEAEANRRLVKLHLWMEEQERLKRLDDD